MNAVAGEKELTIGDEKFLCRPDFKALMGIESELNCGLIDVFERFGKRAPRFTDVVAIVFHCHKSANPDTKETFESLGEKIRVAGLHHISTEAFFLVSYALSGGDDKKKDEATQESGKAQAAQ